MLPLRPEPEGRGKHKGPVQGFRTSIGRFEGDAAAAWRQDG